MGLGRTNAGSRSSTSDRQEPHHNGSSADNIGRRSSEEWSHFLTLSTRTSFESDVSSNSSSSSSSSTLSPPSSIRPSSSSSHEKQSNNSMRRSGHTLIKSSIRKSLQRLDSSHRLSVTCSGSDLGQLYLSSPELDAVQIVAPSSISDDLDNDSGVGSVLYSRQPSSSSWIEAADIYGRRKSFRRLDSYARLRRDSSVDDIKEDEEHVLSIEETGGSPTVGDDECNTNFNKNEITASTTRKCMQKIQSPAFVVPSMMIVDLVLGVGLSLYDSNLLRNVPGFRFPLCYAFTQKFTNALASLVLICLSRRWEAEEAERRMKIKHHDQASPSIDLPSLRVFRKNAVPLSAVALVQTISAALGNRSLQKIPLPLFKVCLMCGPIFVALLTKIVDGQLYSRERMMALSLIGVGACRAVYAEAEGADNPRPILLGAGFALGSTAFGGIGLVLSSVLMHKGGGGNEQEEENELEEDPEDLLTETEEVELNPLSLLFYLSCTQVLMLGAYLCPWDALTLQAEQANEGGEQFTKEPSEFSEFATYFANDPLTAMYYLAMGSTMSLCLAVLTFVLVNRTSPVATSLLGNARSIATVAISSVIAGNAASGDGGANGLFGSAAFGYTMTLCGGVAYAVAALRRDSSPSK